MTIAEESAQYDIEEEDFGSLMLESGVCGYLYKPHYSEEQPRQKTCLPRTRSPDWLGLGRTGGAGDLTMQLRTATNTEIESVCGKEFQR